MAIHILRKDGETIFGNEMPNIENVSFRDLTIKHAALSLCQLFVYKFLLPETYLWQIALKFSEHTFNSMAHFPIPESLNKILDKDLKKKEQVSLLKDCELTTEQLCALFAQAEEKGYSFSHYCFRGVPTAVNKDDLPEFIYVKDGTVEHVGDTTLTDAQMRMVVDQADVLIARILDNGKHWHCFLQTFKGLKGMERGAHGVLPHLHYISDSFGFSRKELVTQLMNGEYPTSPVHISLK